MAILTHTRLETHPDGTTGVAGIVNGNWERLEVVFDPALSSGDLSFAAFTKALIRSATLPTISGSRLEWSAAISKPVFRPGNAATSGTAIAVDMAGAVQQDVTLSGDLTATTTNKATGLRVDVLIRAGASLRNLTWPAWKWIGSAAPATLASGKVALLVLRSFGAADTDIVATWTVEP